ncbi:MAG: hypothetical protein LBG57_06410 [Treponema sp.]|jgi:hypothetical protein|nr:hypothetical protein [Treponema sp.]
MNEEQDNSSGEFALLRLAPEVLRARDFRLYTRGGRRLVDLWLNGGAAVLGHTPHLLLRELKNAASRGLYAPFPHFLEGRFIKALSRLFPGRTFRFYASAPAALEALLKKGEAGLWRPFLDPGMPLAAAADAPPVLIPVLPGIQGWRGGLPQGLCALAVDSANPIRENTSPENTIIPDAASLPAGDFLSPVLLAVAARGVYDLIAAAPERGNLSLPRVTKALNDRNSPWQRRGIYLGLREDCGLRAETGPEVWAILFRRFLDAGFLLPPIPEHPPILPGVLSPGEEAKLAEVLQFRP